MDNKTEKLICYSIGHSLHSREKFLDLLRKHNISHVVDVRSTPYSQRASHFNREFIKENLKDSGIAYVFMGDSLGARYEGLDLCFEDKAVPDFRKVRQMTLFKEGINKLLVGIRKERAIALMCSEKDPFDCHRFVLVSYALKKEGVLLMHILENGALISQEELEEKLLKKYKINYKQNDFLSDIKDKYDAIERAYLLRNKDIGYENDSNLKSYGESG